MESTQDRLLDLSLRLFRPDWPWPVRYGLAVVFTLAIAGLKLSIPAFGAPGPDLFLTIPGERGPRRVRPSARRHHWDDAHRGVLHPAGRICHLPQHEWA